MAKKQAPKSSDAAQLDVTAEASKVRMASTGRNDPCPCGSGKKYKKCHLQEDESAASPPAGPPDPQERIDQGWRLFEQRRPGAAEKEFRAALALKSDLIDAMVGVGMSRLQAGDSDGARKELGAAVQACEPIAADLRANKVKDAFAHKEAQPYVRACHALGCLAFDQDRFEEALVDLERVYAVDEGTVGTEARLIAAKSLLKLKRPADAVPVLKAALKSNIGASRTQLGLAIALFSSGDRAGAKAALSEALEANPHYGRTLLGLSRRRVDSFAAAAPGSHDEAALYAQTYGDVWDDEAKKFLEEVLTARAAKDASPAAG